MAHRRWAHPLRPHRTAPWSRGLLHADERSRRGPAKGRQGHERRRHHAPQRVRPGEPVRRPARPDRLFPLADSRPRPRQQAFTAGSIPAPSPSRANATAPATPSPTWLPTSSQGVIRRGQQVRDRPRVRDRRPRGAEYLVRVRRVLRHGPQRREKFQVIATLVNLTGAPQPDTLEMGLPGQDVPALRFHLVTRNLREEDAALTLDGIAAGTISRCLLSWISLMQGGAWPDIMEHGRPCPRPNRITRLGHLRPSRDYLCRIDRRRPFSAGTREEVERTGINARQRMEGGMAGRGRGQGRRAKGRGEGGGNERGCILGAGSGSCTHMPRDLVAAVEAQSGQRGPRALADHRD